MDLALATSRELFDLDPDDRLLRDSLRARGLSAEAVVWNDDAFDWSRVRACVIRSTWDYTFHHAAFVAWAERVERVTRLWNPARVVRWNTHKSYLRDLEERGVRIVPTAWLAAGAGASLEALVEARGWDEIVVKPAVSGGARDTLRAGRATLAHADEHLAAILLTRDAMVQPYQPSVESRGERSFVFFEGELSHAVRKHPALAAAGHPATGLFGGEPRVAPADDEAAFGHEVLRAARDFVGDEPLLYARVDVARDDRGALALMELELVEPSLFFEQGAAADKLVEAIARRL